MIQKRLAAQILKTSPQRIHFTPENLQEIKEAITKQDLKILIKKKIITKKPARPASRVRARIRQQQKSKGRRQGQGSRKGHATARTPRKQKWISAIRLQRSFIKTLKNKQFITHETYRSLYSRAKGGFFRSKRHIQLYIKENNLVKKP